MSNLIWYGQLKVIEDPNNPGQPLIDTEGTAADWVQDNFVILGANVVNDHEATTDPTAENDADDTAGIGKTFQKRSIWLNTDTDSVWVCTSNATNAAEWQLINEGGISEENGTIVGDGVEKTFRLPFSNMDAPCWWHIVPDGADPPNAIVAGEETQLTIRREGAEYVFPFANPVTDGVTYTVTRFTRR